MQILSLILYGNDRNIRELKFKLGSVNIITGKSRTGKSAIIDIIDYCLGRSTFKVFEGVNRNVVSWYAIKLQFDETQVFIAKPAPKGFAASQSAGHIRVGKTIETPNKEDLTLNTNDDGITAHLSGLLGISSNKHTPPVGQTRTPLEATLAHTKHYLFQEQGEIANRNILFHRQGDQFMPQAIKDTLPYFLGVVKENRLALLNEERELKRKLKVLERKRDDLEQISNVGGVMSIQLLEEAKSVGLIETDQKVTHENIKEVFRNACNWSPSRNYIFEVPSETETHLYLTNALENSRLKLRELNEKLAKIRIHEIDRGNFDHSLNEQLQKLESINVLPFKSNDDSLHCPVCGSVSHNIPLVKSIKDSILKLNDNLETVRSQRPKLLELAKLIQVEIDAEKENLVATQVKLKNLASQNDSFIAEQDTNARIAKTIGRISLYLDSQTEVEENESFDSEIQNLELRLKEIERLLDDEGDPRQQLESVLNRINTLMTKYATELQLEFTNSPYRFDFNNLSVIADTKDRAIPMDRMGSGENWLGCHVISLLAFHKHFIEHKRPVPSILVIDQPSQVYFPSTNSYKALDGTVKNSQDADADFAAVERLFKLMKRVCEELFPKLQIIITEHANLPEAWYQEMLAEEPWRDGNALIPESWIKNNLAN